MIISEDAKTILVVGAIIVLLYFIYKNSSDDGSDYNENSCAPQKHKKRRPVESFASVNQATPTLVNNTVPHTDIATFANSADNRSIDPSIGNLPSPAQVSQVRNFPSDPQSNYSSEAEAESMIEDEVLRKKFSSKNLSKSGYKDVNYAGGVRGALGPSEWDSYFTQADDLKGAGKSNDKFTPHDETNGGFAAYKPTVAKKSTKPEDLFNVDSFLPAELRDDWFEVMPDTINVKNRHLINVSRPIGINTVGSSHKNASYDLRGSPPNPKLIVSPFLNSSIDPDTNIKSIV